MFPLEDQPIRVSVVTVHESKQPDASVATQAHPAKPIGCSDSLPVTICVDSVEQGVSGSPASTRRSEGP